MSQNSSTHPTVLDSPEPQDSLPISLETLEASTSHEFGNEFGNEFGDTEPDDSAVEVYAEQLMDELFEDVDRVLERGGQLPDEPVTPEFVSLQPVAMPSLELPPVLAVRPAALETVDEADLETITAEAIAEAERRRRLNPSFDGLLMVAACVSLLATGLVWFALQQRFQRPAAMPVATAPVAEDAPANQQFLDYVQRSLDRIERDAAANRPVPLPPVAVAGTTPPSPVASAPTVLERIYIPVYQPPQLFNQMPNGAQAPAPAVSPAPAPSAPENLAAAPNLAPAATHVLIGVLELGERSAALFEVNGTPQRIYIGENIAGSGWTLVSIANQEAIIRRNGEVRSIYIGQQF